MSHKAASSDTRTTDPYGPDVSRVLLRSAR